LSLEVRGSGDGGKVGKKEVWEFKIPTEEDYWIPIIYADLSLQIIKMLDTSASPIDEDPIRACII
jgi:hypothetical protein